MEKGDKNKKLVTVTQYAKLTGQSFQNVYYLIEKGHIVPDTITVEQKRIDLKKYPVK